MLPWGKLKLGGKVFVEIRQGVYAENRRMTLAMTGSLISDMISDRARDTYHAEPQR